jgi:tetratricopeptide (TPR) repeat protein
VAIRSTAPALSNLGGTLFFLGRFEEAAEVFEGAARHNERDATVWLNLGRAYHEGPGTRHKARAPLERAVSLAEELLKVNPRDAELIADLADAHAMLGHPERARSLSKRALALAPDVSEILYMAAGIDEATGRRDAALEKIERALAAGYPRWEIERNPSLAALREDPRFAEVLRDATSADGGKRPR